MIEENVIATIWDIFAYTLLGFSVPSLCLKKYSRKWSFTTKFFAYQTIANLYIFFVMQILGFLKMINRGTVFIFVLALPISICVYRDWSSLKEKFKNKARLISQLEVGSYGYALLWRDTKKFLAEKCKSIKYMLKKTSKIEIIVLLAGAIWLIYFYGYFKLYYCGYSCSDEEVHLYWISEMMHNRMFPSGMYPHGFHTLCGVIGLFSPVGIARSYICFSTVTVLLMFFSVYLLMRSNFKSKYVCLVSVGVIMLTSIFQVELYSRFLNTLPMEFGLIATFGMIYFMLKYVSESKKPYLILFSLCITWTLMIHFYVTILCGVICLCFGIVYFVSIIKRRLLFKFLLAGLCGIFIGCVPYGVGFLSGYKFEQSIAWALNVSQQNSDYDEEDLEKDSETDEEEELTENEKKCIAIKEQIKSSTKVEDKLSLQFLLMIRFLENNFVKDYRVVFPMIFLAVFAIFTGLIGSFFKKCREQSMKYIFWGLLWVAGSIIAISRYIDILVLIEVKRMAIFLSFLTIPILIVPIDILITMLEKIRIKKIFVEFIFVVTVFSYFYITEDHVREIRRFRCVINEADMGTCLHLVEHGQDKMWTVISLTNDLSIVRYNGYHYEIIDLSIVRYNGYHYEIIDLLYALDKEDKDVYISTPEIYVLLEKKHTTLRILEKYNRMNEVYEDNISAEHALKNLNFYRGGSNIYEDIYVKQRNIVMSKLFYWMEAVEKVYPNHVELLYDDGLSSVYRIKQDPYFPLNLKIDYKQYLSKDKGEFHE